MQPSNHTMAHARRAVREAGRHFFSAPNIRMIDFGYPEKEGQIEDDKLALRIHVEKKLDGIALESAIERGETMPLPDTFAGFRVDVAEGEYKTHWSGWAAPATSARKLRQDPLSGGISISEEHHRAAGTLGGIVVDRATGHPMILSNWHVLIGDWRAWPTRRIYQPGRLDGGTFADTVADTVRHAMNMNMDAAVAELNNSRMLNYTQFELGNTNGACSAALGAEVIKSGRTTQTTRGRVTATDGIAKLNYGGIERMIRNVITIEPLLPVGQEVSAGGDSGSWWLEQRTRCVVGLHFAGSNRPERGLAIDMPSVLNALGVSMPIDDQVDTETARDVPQERPQRQQTYLVAAGIQV